MTIAIIGGSGFAKLNNFNTKEIHQLDTPYGSPSSPIKFGKFEFQQSVEKSIYFIARHGDQHSIQPHKINYRANIAALTELGVTKIIALAAVGSIQKNCHPGSLVIPHQILDYTYNREMTFFDQPHDVAHAEFTEPYSKEMRKAIIDAAASSHSDINSTIVGNGTYAVTQGPRFESAAEIKRYENDGASIVGMTAMPEAVLAREKGIAYITIASVVNYAAGVKSGVISHDEIHQAYQTASNALFQLLPSAIPNIEVTKVDVPELIYP